MNVLILSDFYPPIVGGTEVYFQSLSKQLEKRGLEITIGTIGHPDLPEYEDAEGVKIYRLQGIFQRMPFLFLDEKKRYHPPIRDLLITRKLAKIIKKIKPDIIHAHGWIIYSVLPLSKKFKIPLIAAPRDFGLICPQKTLLNKNNICNKPFQTECITCGKTTYSLLKSFITYLGVRINSKNLKNVDKFIFGNEYAKKIWQQHLGLDDADVVVIPSYYDPPNSRKREGDKDIELPDDFILYIGALIPQKGINILIEAYRKLAVKTKLVLIGGAYRNYSYRSDENILVLQNMPRQTVMNAISRCKFAIFPMQFPSAAGPMSPLEVMGQKKAIIATNLESVREVIINGETGMLVPPNDTDKLAAAMSYLLERPEIASVMGEKGYTILMNKYLPDIVIPEIIREYQNLVPGYSTKFNMDSII